MQETDDKDKDEAKTRQRQDNMKALKAKGEMLPSLPLITAGLQ